MAKRKKRSYKFKHSKLARWWRKYAFKHTTLAIIFLSIFVLALDTAVIQGLLLSIKELGIFGIFLTGILFVSFFTAGPATIILISVAPDYNPIYLSLTAALGSIIGDWIILKYFEENVGYELAPLAKKYGIMPMIKQMKTRKFRPFAIVIGMFFIASPGPDEVGLGLLGLTNTPPKKLMPLLFLLNSTGIFLLVVGARAIAPIA